MLGVREIQELLERHGRDPRRSLGQNFVADPHLVERIVRLAGVRPGDRVVEIGPGLGSLTLALVAGGAELTVVEKDDGLVPVLREVLHERGADAVRIVVADALALDWAATLGEGGPPWKLVANLPYNVAVPIVVWVLADAPMVDELLVMVQKEVAERLVAGPGGRTVGLPSLRVAWYAAAELVELVPPEVFVPRPRVTSALVRMRRRPAPADDLGPDQVFPLVERAYRQRRKMLRVTLGDLVTPETFERAGIAPTARPEELSITRWAELARAVASPP